MHTHTHTHTHACDAHKHTRIETKVRLTPVTPAYTHIHIQFLILVKVKHSTDRPGFLRHQQGVTSNHATNHLPHHQAKVKIDESFHHHYFSMSGMKRRTKGIRHPPNAGTGIAFQLPLCNAFVTPFYLISAQIRGPCPPSRRGTSAQIIVTRPQQRLFPIFF